MNQVQRKRAIRFANFLLKVPKEQFDIEYICKSDASTRRPLTGLVGKCGTVGCAIGHLPIFNPQRFEYKLWTNGTTSSQYDVKDKVSGSYSLREHAETYLGFSEVETSWLFFGGGYNKSNVTPKDVGNRILNLLNKKSKTLAELKEFAGR